ncbi:hypothetical protein BGZ63DRAFT_450479, partial [Mariannaea sp. PMI_226]
WVCCVRVCPSASFCITAVTTFITPASASVSEAKRVKPSLDDLLCRLVGRPFRSG